MKACIEFYEIKGDFYYRKLIYYHKFISFIVNTKSFNVFI